MLNFFLAFSGLLLFFWGIKVMKHGLSLSSQTRLSRLLLKFTSSPIKGLLLGCFVTMILQSSSAVTVLTIGMVNARLMSFQQTIGIILGTNIGTCFTAQLISFDLEAHAPLMIFSGCLLAMLTKGKLKKAGLVCCGLGLVFLGLDLLTKGMQKLVEQANSLDFFLKTTNHYNGILNGLLLTVAFQSSSAVTGLLVSLAKGELITIGAAFPLVIGSNIGTCITGILAAWSCSRAAKQAAVAHLVLNLLGAIAVIPVIDLFEQVIIFLTPDPARQIAHAHTLFNILNSLLVLPFANRFSNLILWLMPDKPK